MATPLADLLQNSDQLFDENQYQEALDVLRTHAVITLTIIILIKLTHLSTTRIKHYQRLNGVKHAQCINYPKMIKIRKMN